MRARTLVALGLAPVAFGLVIACGLDADGLLDVGGDASIDATTPLVDGRSPPNDGASGNLDSSGDALATVDGGGDDGDDGDGGDDGPSADGNDSAPDAGPCLGVRCGNACLDASTCAACDAGTLLCAVNGRCGPACTHCPGMPIQCFDCDSNRSNPVATCQPQDASVYCLNSSVYPGYHCGCPDDDAGECPGATQTCTEYDILTGDVCQTCGEPNTDQAPCKGGGKCNEANARCN